MGAYCLHKSRQLQIIILKCVSENIEEIIFSQPSNLTFSLRNWMPWTIVVYSVASYCTMKSLLIRYTLLPLHQSFLFLLSITSAECLGAHNWTRSPSRAGHRAHCRRLQSQRGGDAVFLDGGRCGSGGGRRGSDGEDDDGYVAKIPLDRKSNF